MRRVPALLLAALPLAACGRNDTPSPATAGGTAAAAPARRAPAINTQGQPNIVNSVDSVHIEYRVRGAGQPLIVLVHGWSCDSNYWRAQLPALTTRYTVLTVDLAGHGASGRNRNDWSMQNFASDVTAAVRAYWDADPQAPREVVLVGHSMGGPVIVEAARQLGAPVRGLIGVDTFKTFGAPPPNPGELEASFDSFRRDFIGTTRQFVTSRFFQPGTDPTLVRQIADDMSAAPPAVGVPALISATDWFYARHDLADIRVPVLAINGDLTPTDDATIRRSVPTFRSIVLAKRGHFPMMEDPAEFNAVLLREIGNLLRQPAS